MKQETRMKVAALAATSFIMVLVNNALFPVFPQMAKALNINLKSLSLLVAAVSFPAAVLSPFEAYWQIDGVKAYHGHIGIYIWFGRPFWRDWPSSFLTSPLRLSL